MLECCYCKKIYNSISSYNNHIKKHQNDQNDQNDKKENIDGWSDDQMKVAMELSMKEKYKDYIPDTDDLQYTVKSCILCCEKMSSCVFINCGHCITCYDCGLKIISNKYKEERRCPICRKNASMVVKIYF